MHVWQGEDMELMSSPFLTLPNGGYNEVLADIDDGTWYHTMQWGTEGRGLMVSLIEGYAVCEHSDRTAYWRQWPKLPVLVPSVVTWKSTIDQDGYVMPEFDDAHWREINHPPVALLKMTHPISDDPWEAEHVFINHAQTQHRERDESGEVMYDIEGYGEVFGLVAPWTFIPVDDHVADDLVEHIKAANGRFGLDCLVQPIHNCGSDFDPDLHDDHDIPGYWGEYAEEEYAFSNGDRLTGMACGYHWWQQLCDCGRAPTVRQRQISIFVDDGPHKCGHCYLPPQYSDLWFYAVDRYLTGWERAHQFASEGDPWFTSLERSESPFSASPSHARPLLLSCLGSMSSARPQDYSIAS